MADASADIADRAGHTSVKQGFCTELHAARGLAAAVVVIGHCLSVPASQDGTYDYIRSLFAGSTAVTFFFVLSGLVCAFAGILWTLRFATSRYDAGTGLELTVVTIVLLGGVSIFGGRGSVLGVVLAVVIVGCLQEVLTLMTVDAQVQNIITGGLLLVSVILPNTAEGLRRFRARVRRRA